ncbi:MAG: molybdenum cofactor guanylyltransferase [Candidatus Eisenbacteria sp.]|nr:molybdenum cofactor guanylyltransferase [Candidatus Eisenbacteria bacterium]
MAGAMTDRHQKQDLSALVLAGGRGQRFRGEKGLALFRGRTLVERALAVLDCVSDDVWISANQPKLYGSFGRPIIKDIHPSQGPLGGIHAGLTAVRHDLLAVGACDMPFLSGELFLYMQSVAGDHEIVVPVRTVGSADRPHYEPLHALYRKTCLAAIESVLERGERSVVHLFSSVDIREIPEEEWRAVPGIDPRVFENINTRGDLSLLATEEESGLHE